MKKLLSLVLALVLVLSLSVTAFAENITTTGGTTANVTANYAEGTDSNPVYKVDISWGSMAFTYTAASKGTWSVTSHIYEGASKGGWSWAEGANKIKVTNHSNADVSVTPVYTADSAYTSVAMRFDKGVLMMPTADNGSEEKAGTATTGTITAIPFGNLPENTNGKIGQITLKLEPTTTIATAEDLADALQNGGAFKLDNDITLTGAFDIQKNVALDLNHCTVTVQGGNLNVNVQNSGKLALVNGTVTYSDEAYQTPIRNDGNIFIENCTLIGYGVPFHQVKGDSALINCTLDGVLVVENGTVMLSGIKWRYEVNGEEYTGIGVYDAGSVICDFDPTNNIYDGNGTVTDNGNGTWTVTKAS